MYFLRKKSKTCKLLGLRSITMRKHANRIGFETLGPLEATPYIAVFGR